MVFRQITCVVIMEIHLRGVSEDYLRGDHIGCTCVVHQQIICVMIVQITCVVIRRDTCGVSFQITCVVITEIHLRGVSADHLRGDYFGCTCVVYPRIICVMI